MTKEEFIKKWDTDSDYANGSKEMKKDLALLEQRLLLSSEAEKGEGLRVKLDNAMELLERYAIEQGYYLKHPISSPPSMQEKQGVEDYLLNFVRCNQPRHPAEAEQFNLQLNLAIKQEIERALQMFMPPAAPNKGEEKGPFAAEGSMLLTPFGEQVREEFISAIRKEYKQVSGVGIAVDWQIYADFLEEKLFQIKLNYEKM